MHTKLRIAHCNLRWIAITAGTLVTLLLSACANWNDTVPYPLGWATIQHEKKVGSCPRMEGTYYDEGESVATVSGRPCDDQCRSLIFSMVSDEGFVTTGAERALRRYADQVRIRQSSPESMEISTIPGGFHISLTHANGDFICDRDGFRLRERDGNVVTLLVNMFGRESRIFNVADDGTLVMKSEWHNWGNKTFIFANVRGEDWVRWKRVPFRPPESK